MQIRRFNKFLFLVFIAISSVAQAQTGTSSPYSRYGIGDLQTFSHARNAGMGGLSFALREDSTIPDFINFNNPASYSAFKFTSFDASIMGSYTSIKNSRNNEVATNASVQYFGFGFPVTKWWGGCFGLKPYSSIGYGMSDSSSVSDSLSGTSIPIKNVFSGKGGLNQFFIGSSVQPFKNSVARFRRSEKYKALLAEKDSMQIQKIERRLRAASGFSLGVNSCFLFGTLDRERRIEYHNSSYFDFKQVNSSDLGGFYFNLGAQYSIAFKKKMSLVLGAVFTPNTTIKGSQTNLAERFQRIETQTGGYDNVKDTIKYEKSSQGTVTLPMSFGGGVVFKKAGSWQIGFDYLQQSWSNYRAFGQTDALTDSRRFSGGGEIGIGKDKILGRGKTVLRLGGYYTQTYLQLKNTQLVDYGITFGVGFPIARKSSMLNLAFEVGERGTTANDLIKEQYVNMRIGFTFNDKWFLKRKYD